ncbi:MAG: hypothetical protein IPL43_13870 [Micropruina sp.]|nr:hypothetical protein [Micropruina sp.]
MAPPIPARRLPLEWVACQELGHRLRDGFGFLDVQQVADAVDGALLAVGQVDAQELGDLDPQLPGLAAQDRQHRLADGCRVFGGERPLDQRGQLHTEEGVGVLGGLLHRAGHPVLQQ